jgi:hypothetical protein
MRLSSPEIDSSPPPSSFGADDPSVPVYKFSAIQDSPDERAHILNRGASRGSSKHGISNLFDGQHNLHSRETVSESGFTGQSGGGTSYASNTSYATAGGSHSGSSSSGILDTIGSFASAVGNPLGDSPGIADPNDGHGRYRPVGNADEDML